MATISKSGAPTQVTPKPDSPTQVTPKPDSPTADKLGGPLSDKKPIEQIKPPVIDTITDVEWVTGSMMISKKNLTNKADKLNQYYSRTARKYTDTSLGGNISINSPEQPTPYTDIRIPGRIATRFGNKPGDKVNVHSALNLGMGRLYGEMTDDNAQRIFLKFGHANHNSLSRFARLSIDPSSANLANTGEERSIVYKATKLVGKIAIIRAFPLFAIGVYLAKAASTIVPLPSNKYYTLKPDMHNFWGAVTTVVNHIGTNEGLVPPSQRDNNGGTTQHIGDSLSAEASGMAELRKMLPHIYTTNGYIDVYAVMTRTQIRLMRQKIKEKKSDDENVDKINKDFTGYIKTKRDYYIDESTPSNFRKFLDDSVLLHNSIIDKVASLATDAKDAVVSTVSSASGNIVDKVQNAALKGLNSLGFLSYDKLQFEGSLYLENAVTGDDGKTIQKARNKDRFFTNLFEQMDAQFRDGAQYLILDVEYTGSVETSFTNSTKENSMAQALNAKSESSRNFKNSIAGGNIGDGILANTLEGLAGYAYDAVSGAVSGATYGMSDIASVLVGAGYTDIPDEWSNSSVSLPGSTYKMHLSSCANDPISRIHEIYMPLASILVAGVPVSTGSSSYTSPYLCSLFDRGRTSKPLAIITALSITAATGNLGYNRTGKPLAFDVSFTVTDLSKIISMPVGASSLFDPNRGIDKDQLLYDYLSSMTGMSYYDNLYMINKIKRNYSNAVKNLDRLTSSSSIASFLTNLPIISIGNLILPGTEIIK